MATTTKTKTKAELPPNPFLLKFLNLQASNEEAKKVEVLQEYENDALKSIFIWNFDETVISLVPEGEVPYADGNDQSVYSGTLSENLAREAKGGESATGQDLDGRGKTSLRREYKNLYNFCKGGNDSLSNIRREMMFINLLRGLHPRGARGSLSGKGQKTCREIQNHL